MKYGFNYKIIVFGVWDNDDRQEYITNFIRKRRPTATDIKKIADKLAGELKFFDNLLIKVTDPTELTVYESTIF